LNLFVNETKQEKLIEVAIPSKKNLALNSHLKITGIPKYIGSAIAQMTC